MLDWLKRRIDKRWISLLILFIFNLLFYFDILLLSRLKLFLFILFIISFYFELLNYLDSILKENLRKKEEEIKDYYIKLFIMFIKKQDFNKLVTIYYYKNILIVFIKNSEIKLFFLFRRLNMYFINYLVISKIIYWIIMGLFIIPIKLLISFYYESLWKFKEKTLVEIFFKRFDGLIISLIFTTNLLNYFIYYFKFLLIFLNFNVNFILLYIFFLVYILLLLIIFIFNFNYFEEKFNLNWKTNLWYSHHTNLSFVFINRFHTNILGIILKNILIYYVEIDNKLIYNDKFIFLKSAYWDDINLRKIIGKIYYSKLELNGKLLNIINSYERMFWEFKNKPFMNFYEYELRRCIGDFQFNDILWGLKKYENNEEIKKELMRYLKEEIEMFKYLIFKLWDIEKYLGYEKNYISALYINGDAKEFVNNYENGLLTIYDDLVNNLKKTKDKFLDIEDNFDLYVELLINLNKALRRGEENSDLVKFIDKNKINFAHLFEYDEHLQFIKDDKGKEIDFVRGYSNKKLLPILKEMDDNVKKYREEWEKEWKEGRRSYIWKE